MRLSSPAVAVATRPVRASLAAIQRVRVTLWFHASRKVPASSSRVTSGAPQKMPMSAGVRYRPAPPAKYSRGYTAPDRIWLRKVLASDVQLARQPASPLAAYM